ncbi:tetratricopeptide repeat protein [Aurantiacibacter suaedae]|uniref:tetratricopeptide repeat protein n=1 Tax=Aurantiacibacter suaedae TaxID=2545755 RepID=UPI0013872D3B|nr:tetratricopeptide repeat protein [Aurantiacibacter suaedae]
MMTNRPFAALSMALLLAACDAPEAEQKVDAAAAFAEQDYFAARDAAQQALRDNPEDAEALEILARTQIAMGQGGDALLTLDRLANLKASLPDETLLRAEARLQAGDTREALEMLANEQSAEAWRLRALAAGQGGDEAQMLADFAKGRAAAGDKFKLIVAEASYYLEQGDAEAARPLVAQAQKQAPERVETLFVTARLAQLDEDSELASRAYLGILEITPLDRPALLGAITAMGNLGRIDLLRPLVARGIEAYPNDVEFIFLDARVKAEDGEWEAVRDELQKHESAIAGHPDARGLYGKALLELGQGELARAQLAPVFRVVPDDPDLRRSYAKALLDTGDREEARRVIEPLANGPDGTAEDRSLLASAR